MRVGDMALPSFDIERAGLRATAADLDAVSQFLLVGGFAEHAMIEFFAARLDPLKELDRAVDRHVLLIAGDQERDRSLRLAAVVAEILQHGRNAASDAALHVDCAAAIEETVLHLAGERAMAPRGLIAGGHNVGVAGKGDMRRLAADASVEIVDVGGAGLAEGDAVHLEAVSLEEVFEDAERAGIGRSYRWAANQLLGNGESISHAPA